MAANEEFVIEGQSKLPDGEFSLLMWIGLIIAVVLLAVRVFSVDDNIREIRRELKVLREIQNMH